MRILLDHNVPAPLLRALAGHDVHTAYLAGWSRLSNGELIAAAENASFDLLITSDQGVEYQHNWSERKLRVMILSTNDWTKIRRITQQVLDAVNALADQKIVRISVPR
jgi:predicted nuclease of predicted toxin-antitoxin system